MVSEQSQAHRTHKYVNNAWIEKPYGITISLPPYSNMFVVLTYLKSTYVFDCLQHLSTTLFLISTTPLSVFLTSTSLIFTTPTLQVI